VRSISLVRNAATILLLTLWIPNHSFAAEPSSKSVTSAQTIPSASKDYSGATRRHVEVERMRCSADERGRFIPSAGENRGSK